MDFGDDLLAAHYTASERGGNQCWLFYSYQNTRSSRRCWFYWGDGGLESSTGSFEMIGAATRLEEKDREEERKKEGIAVLRLKRNWRIAAARSAEKQAAALENGGPMEPVNKSGKDVSRIRSIYLHLKQNPIPIRAQKA
ncbi:Clathrin light chain [Lucilia cuprina]|nr:Clathrin light chain [Lucilia cuprina]